MAESSSRASGVTALTDQTRNIEAADRKLMDDLRWLGLQWDEGPEVGGQAEPYYQGQRRAKYDAHARRLLDAGQAYYAMDTREELERRRLSNRARRQITAWGPFCRHTGSRCT